jgi:hypothetical protein
MTTELERLMKSGSGGILMPLFSRYSSTDFVRAEDGFGVYQYRERSSIACGIVFAFIIGEIWTIDTTLIDEVRAHAGNKRRAGLPTMEGSFKAALARYASVLQQLGLSRPFRWTAGFQGTKGLGLYYEAPLGRSFSFSGPFGTSVADVIEVEGTIDKDTSPAEALKPFFQKVFDVFGLLRPEYLDGMDNPVE